MSQGPNEISSQMDGFGKWLRTFLIIILTWICAAIFPKYIGFIIQDFLQVPSSRGVDERAAFIAAAFSTILYLVIFAGGIFWIFKIFKKNDGPKGKVLNDKNKMRPNVETRPMDLAEEAVESSPLQNLYDSQEQSQEAQDNLKAEYGAGFLAIEYREDAKAGWEQMRNLPLLCSYCLN